MTNIVYEWCIFDKNNNFLEKVYMTEKEFAAYLANAMPEQKEKFHTCSKEVAPQMFQY